MTELELQQYLRDNGYPEPIVQAGKAGLIDRWRKFVHEVELGYKRGLEEYRNDLDIRGILALAGLDGEVGDLDKRLEAMLTARDIRVWESGAGDPFWDFGYPKNARGALIEGLREENLA